MVKDAKIGVFCNFMRVKSFNRLTSLDETKERVLSLTPEEYASQWFSFDFRKVKSMAGAMKNLLAFFLDYFSDYLRADESLLLDLESDERDNSHQHLGVSLPYKMMLP